jgi:DNA polymerase-3 subunit epsilon
LTIKLCFVDTETTGTDPDRHGLLTLAGETGSLDLEKKAYLQLDKFSYKMCPFPNDLIEDDALEVNRFTREAIQLFPSPKDVNTEFQEVLARRCDKFNREDKYFLVAYNAHFDADFIRNWFIKSGDKYYGSWFFTPPLDCLQLAAFKLLSVRHTMSNFRLSTTAQIILGKEPVKNELLHTADYDVQIMKEMFIKLIGQCFT